MTPSKQQSVTARSAKRTKVAGVLEILNRYVGALLASLTGAMIVNGVVMYEFTGRIDERVQTLEAFQQQQIQVNKSMQQLASTVAVIQDRQDRESDG